ncbi:MAG: hypothetical protein ACYCXY_01820 [Acidimicrobiales bacterium]
MPDGKVIFGVWPNPPETFGQVICRAALVVVAVAAVLAVDVLAVDVLAVAVAVAAVSPASGPTRRVAERRSERRTGDLVYVG